MMKLSKEMEDTGTWASWIEGVEQLEVENEALLDALQHTRRRLWERRFEFSDADHAAMDEATEAIRKAKAA